jgi:hypothetical protein
VFQKDPNLACYIMSEEDREEERRAEDIISNNAEADEGMYDEEEIGVLLYDSRH